MSSAEHISIVEYAVDLCHDYDLKREILYASGLDYDPSVKDSDDYDRKQLWNAVVQKKAALILKNSSFSETMKKQIEELAIPIGMKMLTWAVYHERTIGFSREYSINNFQINFFTKEGIVDNKKAAEELVKDPILTTEQRYKLACLYCLEEFIYDLYGKMTETDQKLLLSSDSELIRFWSYDLRGRINELRGEKTLDEYRFEVALQNGSKAAVEYCLNKNPVEHVAIINAAVETVRNVITRRGGSDWIVFQGLRFRIYDSWVPSDYYVDILRYLLSQMTVDARKNFLHKDTETAYNESSWVCSERSRALECFLKWPYQVHFMETARLMWSSLQEYNYAILLLKICDKIAPTNKRNVEYGEEKCFDYRRLLKEFWTESPEHCKLWVFTNEKVTYVADGVIAVEACAGLLKKLLTSESYNCEDVIRVILRGVTDRVKQFIFLDEAVKNTCCELIEREKWETLNSFIEKFSSYVEPSKFKWDLIFRERTQRVIIDLMKLEKWNALGSFIEWSSLNGVDLKRFKEGMINSMYAENVFLDLVLYKKNAELANKILEWCLPTEDKIEYRKIYIPQSRFVEKTVIILLLQDKITHVDELIKWCLPSQDRIKGVKHQFATTMKFFIHKILTSYPSRKDADFQGGKWGRVDRLLNWLLPSREEIREFKKQIYAAAGAHIYSTVMKSEDERERFRDWFCLSDEQMQEYQRKRSRY